MSYTHTYGMVKGEWVINSASRWSSINFCYFIVGVFAQLYNNEKIALIKRQDASIIVHLFVYICKIFTVMR